MKLRNLLALAALTVVCGAMVSPVNADDKKPAAKKATHKMGAKKAAAKKAVGKKMAMKKGDAAKK